MGVCRECQKFRIWQEWDVFGKVFGIYGSVFGSLEGIYGSGFIISWRRKPPGLFHSAKNRKESAKNMAFGSGTDIFGILGQVFGIADCAFIMEGCLCVFNAIFFLPLFLQSHGMLLLGGILPGGERGFHLLQEAFVIHNNFPCLFVYKFRHQFVFCVKLKV